MADRERWASLRFDLYPDGIDWEFQRADGEGLAPEAVLETLYGFLDQWLARFEASSAIHPDDVKVFQLLREGWPRPEEGSAARELQTPAGD